jgi:hypothetical protein
MVLFPNRAEAQSELSKYRIAIIGGVGNYESLYAGLQFSNSQHHFFECAVGMSPWSFTDDFYVMEYACFGFPFLKKPYAIKTFIQWKLLHWNFEDEDLKMSVMATGPEVRFSFAVSPRVQLEGNGGIVYNMALKYKRKNYEEVGWLNRFGPSFSLQCNYKLK